MKKYREVLKLFINESAYQNYATKPFLQDNFAVATDSFSMVCFDSTLLGNQIDFADNKVSIDALKIIPTEHNESIKFTTNYLESKLKELYSLFSEKYSKDFCNCPDCNGYGSVNYEFIDHKGNAHKEEFDCPTCIDSDNEEFTVFTNKETKEQFDYVELFFDVKKALFKYDFFQRVLKVAQLIECDTIEIVSILNHSASSDTKILKLIVGDCIIIFMSSHPKEYISIPLI